MKKVALITGSSRGIGRACAETLSEAGWAVCINCIERTDLAAALCESLRQKGRETIWVQADVADAEAVRAMVERTERELGPVSLLVNNAGIARQQQFQDIDRATWDRVFAVNLGGCYNTIQAVLPHMLHEHAGCIVNMSSVWGRFGASCESTYSSTKHAIVGLTRSLAAELAPSGPRHGAGDRGGSPLSCRGQLYHRPGTGGGRRLSRHLRCASLYGRRLTVSSFADAQDDRCWNMHRFISICLRVRRNEPAQVKTHSFPLGKERFLDFKKGNQRKSPLDST